MTSYKQSRSDFEYLEKIAEVYDLVEIDAVVFELMENPTKAKAAELYQMGISQWFSEHRPQWEDMDRRCKNMVRRYGLEYLVSRPEAPND